MSVFQTKDKKELKTQGTECQGPGKTSNIKYKSRITSRSTKTEVNWKVWHEDPPSYDIYYLHLLWPLPVKIL